MKYIITICCCFSLLFSFSQINPGQSIFYQTDTCNFNSSWNRLFIDTMNPNNNWQIGATTKPYFGQANSLPNAIMTDTTNAYQPNNWSYFDLGFQTSDGSGFGYNMYLSFDHKYETDTLIDGGYITISYDSGQTWQNIIFDSTCIMCSPNINSQNLYTTSDTLMNGQFGFSGTSNWKTTTIQWIWALPVRLSTQFISDSMIVRFNFISDGNHTSKDGWIIDNFGIGMIDLGSAVEEYANPLAVKLYPNLTSDKFNYQTKNNETLDNITILDISGVSVLKINHPKSADQIDVSNLPVGNYLVQFTSKNNRLIKKIVKN